VDGVDETQEWKPAHGVAQDICVTCEQWQALQPGAGRWVCSADTAAGERYGLRDAEEGVPIAVSRVCV
jgi:hypothetical protein